MVIKELLDKIASECGLTIGEDLFLGALPSDVDSGVVVSEIGGQDNDSRMFAQNISVQVFENSYVAASRLARDVHMFLSHSGGIALASLSIKNSVPVNIPQFIGVNQHNQYIFTNSFIVYYES